MASNDVVPNPPPRWAVRSLIGIFVVTVPLALLSFLFDNSTELYPDHSDVIGDAALGIAILLGAVTFGLAFRIKSTLKRPPVTTALAWAIGAAVLGGLGATSILDQAVQTFDFSQHPVRQYEQYLPIRRAYVSHGKGHHYHVQLAQFPVDLFVSEEDYEASFRGDEDVHPRNMCLRAPLQQSGAALRIMLGSTSTIPTGSLGPCPPVVQRM